MLYADANSTQYGKMVGASGVQDLLKPYERHGRVRVAYFSATTPASGAPSATEFLYLTKIPAGSALLAMVIGCGAGLQGSGDDAVAELETGGTEASPTYTTCSGAILATTGVVPTLHLTALATAGAPLLATNSGRIRFNPTANTVAAKSIYGAVIYAID